MNRRTAREKAFQALFQINNGDIEADLAIQHVVDEPVHDAFLNQLVHGVTDNQQQLDEWIAGHLVNWSFNRLPKVEKTALRMAAYEMKFNEDVPSQVAINEAVELAKTFGEEESGKFVNGVLSKMMK
ncbi:transcription antitermination factor NusB [Halobacillus salinarum]|uniref:Transcription antitermination protein NusB n=1 Tax=Halobacillus salinarum TaxID=2932257 RepID=A0ABY4EDN5_9BACI|nr:transcription antitermination factor NusB [Halobacillus salinarum]UOQ42563.1 transcription antitermination factor NusB [Halobacillus salinarum]